MQDGLYRYPYSYCLHVQEGFASQVQQDWLARIYFLSFNITTLVIFEVVISFIVEAFVFRILARQRSRICPTHQKQYHYCNCVNCKYLLAVRIHTFVNLGCATSRACFTQSFLQYRAHLTPFKVMAERF